MDWASTSGSLNRFLGGTGQICVVSAAGGRPHHSPPFTEADVRDRQQRVKSRH
jgi:hypothetical protein